MNDLVKESEERKLETLTYLFTDFQEYLNDSSVTEVMVNPDGAIWIKAFGKGEFFSNKYISKDLAENIIKNIAGMKKMICDEKKPLITIDVGNLRFSGCLPPVVENPSFTIRKSANRLITFDDYIKQGVMSPEEKKFIKNCIKDRFNIIFGGATGTGKTTMMNAALDEYSQLNQRLVIIEDAKELKCAAKDVVFLRATDDGGRNPEGTSMAELVQFSLRYTPTRLIIGEVRKPDAASAMLEMWDTGHPGGCTSIHCNSAEDALYRLQSLLLQKTEVPQNDFIGRVVDIIIFLSAKGGLHIEEIVKVNRWDSEKQKYDFIKIR